MIKTKVIKKEDIEDVIALTPMQSGMLFHYMQDSESYFYFEQFSISISGEINIDIFTKAWNSVISNNEMLRTFYKWEKLTKPVQVILKENPLQVIFHDFSNEQEGDKSELIEKIKKDDRQNKFDLKKVPFRITLCKIDECNYEMIISYHHIIFDGWSNGIILKEFFDTYDKLENNEYVSEVNKTKFKEYVKWIQNQDENQIQKFWSDYLKEFEENTKFLLRRKDNSGSDRLEGYGNCKLKLSTETINGIENFIRENNITIANFFYTVWGILLQKYNGSNDIVYGTTVSGRSAAIKGKEDMVGLFINTIPVRVKSQKDESFESIFKRVNNELLKRGAYEHTPLVHIKDYCAHKIKGEFFDTIVVIENYPLEKSLLNNKGRMKINSFSMFEETHYNLTILIEMFGELAVNFKYNERLYNTEDIQMISNHFESIINTIVNESKKSVKDCNIISNDELKDLFSYSIKEDETKIELDYNKENLIGDIANSVGSLSVEVENTLINIFVDVLKVDKEKLDADSNFFELGGHSLNAMELISRIQKNYDVQLSVNKIFVGPKIKMISKNIISAMGNSKKADSDKKANEITLAEKKDYYILSSDQKRLFILQQRDEKSTPYNLTAMFSIEGTLNMDKLEKAFYSLIKRHESLRTSFEVINNEQVQKIHEDIKFNMEFFDLSQKTEYVKMSEHVNSIELKSILARFVRPFDLKKAPLLRVGIVKINEHQNLLLIDTHHIITDGISIGIMLKDFADFYRDEELAPLKVQYKDYCEWKNTKEEMEKIKDQKNYWMEKFKTEPELIDMPYDFERPAFQSFEGEQLIFKIESDKIAKLNSIASKENTTIYMLLLTMFNVLLAKVSGQEEITIGIPATGRRHPELQPVVGMFTNTLVIKNYINNEDTFKKVLSNVMSETLESIENQDFSFEELINALSFKRDLSRNPMFDIMFDLQKSILDDISIPGLKMNNIDFGRDKSRFDLSFFGEEKKDYIEFTVEYCTRIYKKCTIQRFIKYYENIIDEIIEAEDKNELKISNINILSQEEKMRILYEFNNTNVSFNNYKPVYELFEEQVKRTPDKIAISFKDRSLTYNQLNMKANQLAHYIRDMSIGENPLIGIYMERSLELVISILAIIKCGGAYIPIDPSYPEDRIMYMLNNANSVLIITQDKYEKKINSNSFGKICIDTQWDEISLKDCNNPSISMSIEKPAYVIYTSGSTGNPKGVVIPHRALLNHMNWINNQFKFVESDIFFQKTPFSFDASVWEFYAPLLAGGKLVIAENERHHNVKYLIETIIEEKISIIQLVPSILRMLLKEEKFSQCKSLKYVFCGGEMLTNDIKEDFYSKFNIDLVNLYGPTETCIDATYYICKKEKEDIIPIGRPVYNTSAYILDKNLQPVPIGIKGELYIGGDNLALGYLHQPKLTSERFIINTFSKNTNGLFYKTGDMARFREDGCIEMLGRADNQVKIRGIRIELEEIERFINEHKDIQQAAVSICTTENNQQEQFICAYIVSEKTIDVNELKEFAFNKLPNYMIPSHFIQMQELPLTANGKIDRKKLPKVIKISDDDTQNNDDSINEQEKIILDIWKDVLERDNISVNDNFFEIGGHSLRAALIIANIQEILGVEISMQDFFNITTVRQMSQLINKFSNNQREAIPIAEKKDYYLASSTAKRMYILQQLNVNSTHYNIPVAVHIKGDLDENKLKMAFDKLVHRHDAFRTSFVLLNEEVMQKISDVVQIEIEYLHLGEDILENDLDKIIQEEIIKFIRPFNLNKAPLMRIGILKISDSNNILIMDMHHIISDRISQSIIVKDLILLYGDEKLPELKYQYKDYSEWQNSLEQQENIKKQGEYWFKKFDNEVPIMDLPTDFPRPVTIGFDGRNMYFNIESDLTREIKDFISKNEYTFNIFVLSAFNVFLYKYTEQEDIVVGVPVAGRRNRQLFDIVGSFINMLAIRSFPKGKKTFSDFTNEVKQDLLMSYDNQDFAFDDLIGSLNDLRRAGRHPLVEAVINTVPEDQAEYNLNNMKKFGLDISIIEIKNVTTHFDLSLYINEYRDRISILVEYNINLFKDTSIQRMGEQFIDVIKQIIKNPDILLEGIFVKPYGEEAQVFIPDGLNDEWEL